MRYDGIRQGLEHLKTKREKKQVEAVDGGKEENIKAADGKHT